MAFGLDLLHLYTQLVIQHYLHLHTLQFTITYTPGFPVFIGRIMAMDFNTVIISVSL
jgi:hypothetical protein